jgi:hypothetical protein
MTTRTDARDAQAGRDRAAQARGRGIYVTMSDYDENTQLSERGPFWVREEGALGVQVPSAIRMLITLPMPSTFVDDDEVLLELNAIGPSGTAELFVKHMRSAIEDFIQQHTDTQD